jgi:hypothetical protein
MKKEEALVQLINAGYEPKEAEAMANEVYTNFRGADSALEITINEIVKIKKKRSEVRIYGLNENGNLVDSE